jgi:hypothetical protein
VQLGAYGSRFNLGWVTERYEFHLAPLLFLAFALWLARGLPQPRRLTALAFVLPIALLVSVPFETNTGPTLSANALSLAGLLRLATRLPGGWDSVRLLVAAGTVAAAACAVALPRRTAAIILPAAVALALLLLSYPTYWRLRAEAAELKLYGAGSDPTWIDRVVGAGHTVAVLYAPLPNAKDSTRVLMEQEFWNRRLSHVYYIGTPAITGLTQSATKMNRRTGVVEAKLGTNYVLVPSALLLNGKVVEKRKELGAPFTLYRVTRPLRIRNPASVTSGLARHPS